MPDTSDTSATQATRMQHECETSDTIATRVRHERQLRHKCYTNNTSATRVKNFDFDSDTGKNIFTPIHLPYGK